MGQHRKGAPASALAGESQSLPYFFWLAPDTSWIRFAWAAHFSANTEEAC